MIEDFLSKNHRIEATVCDRVRMILDPWRNEVRQSRTEEVAWAAMERIIRVKFKGRFEDLDLCTWALIREHHHERWSRYKSGEIPTIEQRFSLLADQGNYILNTIKAIYSVPPGIGRYDFNF